MTSSQFATPEFSSDRAVQVRRIIDDYLDRRGEEPPLVEEDVLAAHPDLAADLRKEFRKLSLIQNARQKAQSTLLASLGTRLTDCAAGSDTDARTSLLAVRHALPGYEILCEIHRGGQGVIYEAVQQSTKRTVAVKVLHEGPFAGPADRLRFEREIEILATLRHPAIVAIHDSGSAAGHFYYVMDYIRGRTLDRWNLDLGSEILDLKGGGAGAQSKIQNPKSKIETVLSMFLQICDAVQAAHLRGVIHRDLKPGNILVDEQGRLHVLDFGLAKRAANGDPARAKLTHTRDFLGTPIYASPEQARGANQDVDVRSDVFALGLILFELLTDRLPYPPEIGLSELLQAIQHVEPPRPSALRLDLPRDLDAIVLKALNKEREERYQSVDAFAADVRRFLIGETVLAHPPSLHYQLRKFVRRHRTAVGGAAAFALLLITATIVTTVLYIQAETARQDEFQQRRRADAERDRADQQRDVAQANAERAAREAAKAAAVNQFLQDMLKTVDPNFAGQRDITMREMLDQAARKIEAGAFRDQPEIEAAVRTTLGNAYANLSRYAEAEPHLRTALAIQQRLFGADHVETAIALDYLASLLQQKGEPIEAERLYRQALAIHRRQPDGETIVLARNLDNLATLLHETGRYAEAEQGCREALAIRRRRLGPEHAELATNLDNLATMVNRRGDRAEAETLSRQALAMRRKLLGEESLPVAQSFNNLAFLISERGDPAAAESYYRQALAIRRKLLGNEHALVATSLNNLAALLRETGDLAGAEPLYREALAIQRAIYAGAHLHAAATIDNLASLLQNTGRDRDAEQLHREALAMRRKLLPPNHANIARNLNNLAFLLHMRGDRGAAEGLYREALEVFRAVEGGPPLETVLCLRNLGDLLAAQGGRSEAVALYREALAVQRVRLPAGHSDLRHTLNNLAGLLLLQDQAAEAEPLLRESLALDESGFPAQEKGLRPVTLLQLGCALTRQGKPTDNEPLLAPLETLTPARSVPENQLLVFWLWKWAGLLQDRGQTDQAERLWRRALDLRRRTLSVNDPVGEQIAFGFAATLMERLKAAEAETLLNELLENGRARWPPNSRMRGDVLNLLGIALLDQRKVAEALPILEEGVGVYRKILPPDDSTLISQLTNYGRGLTLAGRAGEAEPILREVVGRLEKSPATEARHLQSARSVLGGCLAAQGRHVEAEPLLLESAVALQNNPRAWPPRVRDALERVAQLYEAWDAAEPGRGHAEQAAVWRAKLNAARAASQPASAPAANP